MKFLLLGVLLLSAFSSFASEEGRTYSSFRVQSKEYQEIRKEVKALSLQVNSMDRTTQEFRDKLIELLDLEIRSDGMIDDFSYGTTDDIKCVREVRTMDIWNGGCSQTIYYKNHYDENHKGSFSHHRGKKANVVQIIAFRKSTFAKKCTEFKKFIVKNYKTCNKLEK